MAVENRFRFTGVECIRFAVEDLQQACRFAADWGLTSVESPEPALATTGA